MEAWKKRLHQSNVHWEPSSSYPVRLHADRVPTFSLIPTDVPDSSKVVLNKDGWNSKQRFSSNLNQKSLDQDEDLRPRGILRETNDNFKSSENGWKFSSQPLESYSGPVPSVYNDASGFRNGERFANSHTDVTTALASKTTEMSLRLGSSYDRNTGFHKFNGSHRQEEATDNIYKGRNLPQNGEIQYRLNPNDDRPIFSATSLHERNNSREKNGQSLINEKSKTFERNHQERFGEHKSQTVKQAKIGLKAQLHKDHKGLERVKQLVERQRIEGRDDKVAGSHNVETFSRPNADHGDDILSHGTDGQFPSRFSKPVAAVGNDVNGMSDLDYRGFDVPLVANDDYGKTRPLHQSNDPVQPNKKIKYESKPVNIPRKVAQAPAPPSYKGFSEVGGSNLANSGHGVLIPDNGKKRDIASSVSGPHAIQPASGTGRSYKSGLAKNAEDSNNKRINLPNGHAAVNEFLHSHPASNKNLYETGHQKLSKPNKTDINVRSWRKGNRVIEQHLGKLPKMSLSPPTKGCDPEQNPGDSDLRSTSNSSSFDRSQKDYHVAREDSDIFKSHWTIPDDKIEHSWNQTTDKDMSGDLRLKERNLIGHLEAERDKDFDEEMDGSESYKADAEHNDIVHLGNHEAVKLPAKSKAVSLPRKKKHISDIPDEKEKEPKTKRDRSYDKEEVQKYMAKQRAERKQKLKGELMEKQRAEENKHRQLESLSRKQKESAWSKFHIAGKGNPRTGLKDNSTDSDSHRGYDVSFTEVSSSEERKFGQIEKPIDAVDKSRSDGSGELVSNGNVVNSVEAIVPNRFAVEPVKSLTGRHLLTAEGETVPPRGRYSGQLNAENRGAIPSKFSDVSSAGSSDPGVVPEALRNRAERWASLAQSARSLSSRINSERNTFTSAFSARDDSSSRPAAVSARNNVASDLDAAKTTNAFISSSRSMNSEWQLEEAVDDDDDDDNSTLTEDSVSQPVKTSSLLPHQIHGTNSSNIASNSRKPSNHKIGGEIQTHKRKKADIERWITKRSPTDSNEDSTLTGSNVSDVESESKDSINSGSAVMPIYLPASGVTSDPHSEYVLRLRMLQQSHSANMLSLQAKSQHDLILATRRPFLRKESNNTEWTKAGIQKAVASSEAEKIALGLKSVDASLLDATRDVPALRERECNTSSRTVLLQETTAGNRSDEIHEATKNPEKENIFLSSQAEKSSIETDLDASVTEEEMERSMRDILPSEKLIKKLKQHGSLTNLGPTVDQSSAKHIFDSDSFDSFSLNMVHTYLTQEQSRMHHQHMLLKLREQALAEKTRAQLAWWEQQKLQRKKGSDDSYPMIHQKQKEILEKHKKDKSNLHVLQNLARQALSIGCGSMSDLESIKFMQQAAQKIKQRIDSLNPKIRKWLDTNSLTPRILSSDSEVTVSAGSGGEQVSEGLKEVGYECDDVMVSCSELPNKDQRNEEIVMTDSSESTSLPREVHGDVNQSHSASPAKEKIAQKLKMQMDSRYLTIREKKLRQRRLEAEKLLAWKNRLDREEEEVIRLEMEAAQKILLKRETSVGSDIEINNTVAHDRIQNLINYKDCSTSPINSPSTADLIENHQDYQFGKASQKEPKQFPSSILEGPAVRKDGKILQTLGEKGSVENTSVNGASVKQSKLPSNGEEVRANSLFEHVNQKRRESMSETEDSVSVPLSETTTDQSELERQTKALQKELRMKRIKVENLRKQKRKEEIKAKEDSLKKQIELADEEIKKLTTAPLKHSEQPSSAIPSQEEQSILGSSIDESPRSVTDSKLASADRKLGLSLELNPGIAAKNSEDASDLIKTSLQPDADVLNSRPKSYDTDTESEKSAKINEPVDITNKLLNGKGSEIVFASDDTAFEKLKQSRNGSLDEFDVDDFFDRKINDALSSNNAFMVLNSREASEHSAAEKQNEFDLDESDKSISSNGSKNSRSEMSRSVASSKSSHLNRNEISDAFSQTSEKSKRSSVKSVDKEAPKQLSEDDIDAVVEIKNDDESASLENSINSVSSSVSKSSRRSHDGNEHSDRSVKSKIGYTEKVSVRNNDLNEKDEDDDSSIESVKSSKKYSQLSKASDVSKKSQDSKGTVRSSSKSYKEDFSNASKNLSRKESPDVQQIDDHASNHSETEEVKTEDDINSLLSEDEEGSMENIPVVLSDVGFGKAVEKEFPPTKLSVEEPAKNSNSSDDNILKEDLPELPSETDLPNNFADQTLGGDEHSLSGGAGDSELDRVISSAAAAVELFDGGSSEVPSKVTTKVTPDISSNTQGVDAIADDTMKGLVSEAVSEVLSIKSKRELSPEKLSIDQSDSASLPKSPESANPERPTSSLPLFDNDWWDGEYLDDDFGWSSNKPPPPYEQKPSEESPQPATHVQEQVVRIPEPTIIVPHTSEEILLLADEAVKVFWHLRRCGESWDDVQPTAEYFGADAIAATPEQSSRRMYKQLIFDAVAEFLLEMYQDEDRNENTKFFPLIPPPLTKWQQYYKEKSPPTTLDVLGPVVRSYAGCIVGQQIVLQKIPRKWLSRRKDDGVDRVLTKELHEEEPEWVSYEEDTVKIKFQLAESIFQLLLTDAARTFASVYERIGTNEKSKS